MLPARLILHIGGGKTGSSFLQHAFTAQREALRSAGVHYPVAPSDVAAAGGRVTSGNAVALAQRICSEGPVDRAGIIECLNEAVSGAGGADVLLSSEAMQQLCVAPLKFLVEHARECGYQVVVVYYVRSAVGRAYSSWVQRIKRHRDTRDFTQCAPIFPFPGEEVVRRLMAVLPREQLLVRNYDVARPSLFTHFARTVLPEAAWSIRIPHREINRSLSATEVELMRQLNGLLDTDRQGWFAGEALMLSDDQAAEVVVTQEQYDALAVNAAAEVAALNELLPADEQVAILGPRDRIGKPAVEPMRENERALMVLFAALLKRSLR